jgi:hypothetical protein
MLTTRVSMHSKRVCAIFILAAAFCAGLWPRCRSGPWKPPTRPADRRHDGPAGLRAVLVCQHYGHRFLPGETVDNRSSDRRPGSRHDLRPLGVVADANGNFTATWYVFSEDLPRHHTPTDLDGESSGLSAQATFTMLIQLTSPLLSPAPSHRQRRCNITYTIVVRNNDVNNDTSASYRHPPSGNNLRIRRLMSPPRTRWIYRNAPAVGGTGR